jgi:phosphohistidine swiveling domain-containing protein
MAYFLSINHARNYHGIGKKASNLRWLRDHGYRIPETHVLPYWVYNEYLHHRRRFQKNLKKEIRKKLRLGQPYAVRSSANLEDGDRFSFAGQFATYLDVYDEEAILQAVFQVYRSMETGTSSTYLKQIRQETNDLNLAVIIQEMVNPVVSGVAFSKNPLTGLDEIVVEAVRGNGEKLVQGGQTPSRWIYKWGDWVAQVVSEDIDRDIIENVVKQTRLIAQQYGTPIDLEWVYDGDNLIWLQLRPITGLEEINIYSNHISKEMFPGLIKPLVWSVNVPLVNFAWINLLTEITGPNGLKPEDLAKTFAFRAYFNMGILGRIFEIMGFPKESLELLVGLKSENEKPSFKPSIKTLRHLPRMLKFLLTKLSIGRKVMPCLSQFQAEYAEVVSVPIETLGDEVLLGKINRLFEINRQVAYYNIIIPLSMMVFDGLLRRQLSTIDVDYRSFDLMHGMEELQPFDPNFHIRNLAKYYNQLDEALQELIAKVSFEEFRSIDNLGTFKDSVADFLRKFGHLSESGNDFSSSPWSETPELVLQMIKTEAHQIKETQQLVSQDSGRPDAVVETDINPPDSSEVNWDTLNISPFKRLRMVPIYHLARRFRFYREAVSSNYTYGYGLFRSYFLELGRRFVQNQTFERKEDIFYLYWDEIKALVEGKDLGNTSGIEQNPSEIIKTRKSEMESSRDLVLPGIIYGEELPLVQAVDKPENLLKGVPSSRGLYRGKAKVIRTMADFDKLDKGDVLIIPYSDVSWTPLFALAGAVISESGGMLSHSSIVAREYGLPCVVSVPNACKITDNTIVLVDGFKGELYLSYD